MTEEISSEEAYALAVEIDGSLDRSAFLNLIGPAWAAGKLALTGIRVGGNDRQRLPGSYAVDYSISYIFLGRLVLVRRTISNLTQFGDYAYGDHMFLSEPEVVFFALRLSKDDLLKLLAAPMPSDEIVLDLIRGGVAKHDGFISQKDGAKIVRGEYPDFNDTRARQLTKSVTGNTKRGPRGPRK